MLFFGHDRTWETNMEQHHPQTNGVSQPSFPAAEEDHPMLSIGDDDNDTNNNDPIPTTPPELIDNAARVRHRLIATHVVSLKETIATSSALIARESQMVIDMLELHLRELRQQNPERKPTPEELKHHTAIYDLVTEHMKIKNEYSLKAMKELKESWMMEDYLGKLGEDFGVDSEEEDDYEEEGDGGEEYEDDSGYGTIHGMNEHGGEGGGGAIEVGETQLAFSDMNEGQKNVLINGIETEVMPTILVAATGMTNGETITTNGYPRVHLPLSYPSDRVSF